MDRFDEGLRCQDVHAGLRNVDPNSGTLEPLMDTQMIGMAASLAALIRGQEVVNDAHVLRAVAAEQLDVNQFAFDPVTGSPCARSRPRQIHHRQIIHRGAVRSSWLRTGA